jgi:hypothetical protein
MNIIVMVVYCYWLVPETAFAGRTGTGPPVSEPGGATMPPRRLNGSFRNRVADALIHHAIRNARAVTIFRGFLR